MQQKFESECHKENRGLREKCPNTEFFQVRIFQYSDQKNLRIWTFHAVQWNANLTNSREKMNLINRKSDVLVLLQEAKFLYLLTEKKYECLKTFDT